MKMLYLLNHLVPFRAQQVVPLKAVENIGNDFERKNIFDFTSSNAELWGRASKKG